MANLDSGQSNINIDGGTTQFTDFGGADTYTILPSLSANVEIIDNNPSTILLPANLDVTETKFLSNGVIFTINGFTVTLLGTPADFSFIFGGTPLDANAGTSQTFEQTAVSFGTTVPAPGAPINTGTTTGPINIDGSVGSGSGGGTGEAALEAAYAAAKATSDAAATKAATSAAAATAAQAAADTAEAAVTDAATAATYKTAADAAKAAADTAKADADAAINAAIASQAPASATANTDDNTEAAAAVTAAAAAQTAAADAQTVANAEVVTADAAVLANQPGTTITLTTATDQPGGAGAGTDTQGTAGNDAYSANYTSGGGGSLQSTDNIAAAGGDKDALTVRVISTTGTESVAPEATGLEEFVINNQTGNGIFILDFNSIVGETTVTAAQNASDALTGFDNLDTGTKIRLVDNDGIMAAHFKGDRGGSTDPFDLYVADSGTTTQGAVFQTTSAQASGTDTSFEIASIEVGGTGPSYLDIRGLELTTLAITGSQELNLVDTEDNFSTLMSVDASGLMGGGLNLNASGNTVSSFSYMGSAQSDRLELSSTFLQNVSTLSLDGGDETDTLVVNSFTNIASSVNKATSFEQLEASGRVSTLVAGDFTGINTFAFAGQTESNSRVTISEVSSNDKFIFKSDSGRSERTVEFQASTSTSVILELEAQSGTDGEIRIVTDTGSGNNNGAIGFNNNITSVEIISSGSNEKANVIRSVDNNYNHYAFDNGDGGPSNFSISGSQALTITAEEGVDFSGTQNNDEFGFQTSAVVDGSNATGNLRIAGSESSSGDTIIGGSGDDIFYGMSGNDMLTGNGGSDQFRFFESNTNNTDMILDFVAGEDKVGLEIFDFTNTTASSAGQTLSTEDYVENVTSVSGLNNSENHKVVELQLAASQTQISTNETTGAIEAYVVVFNSTSGKGELWYDANWSTASGRTQTAEFSNITDLASLTGLSNTDFVEFIF